MGISRMIRFARRNPIIDSVSHNLLQKCFASGTPKGKSKLKTNQALKRKKISNSGDGGRISDVKHKVYDQCINDPVPIRYLRPKDVEREAEREKLGLISKERQKEIDLLRKNRSSKTVTDEPVRIGAQGLDYIALGIFKEDELPKYKVTVEDGRRLAKEYSRVLMREHRAKRMAEANLRKLREAAVEALPEELKKAALEQDVTPFPTNMGVATLTPPIEGYLERIMNAAAKKSSSKEKLR